MKDYKMQGVRNLIRNKLLEFLNEQIQEPPVLNKNFVNWFGGSKITKNGSPMVCYHGTSDSNIHVFDIDKIGNNKGNHGHYGYGFYFSEEISEAKGYGPVIYKCYLKIENPFTGTDSQVLQLKEKGASNIDDEVPLSIDFESFKQSFKDNKLAYDFINDMETHGSEYAWNNAHSLNKEHHEYDLLNDIHDVMEYTTLNKDVNGIPEYIINMLNQWNIHPVINKGFEFHQALHWITDLGNRSKEITEIIKELGYDGVYYGSEIVAFYPGQIKSVNNDGSWDINDNDIYS